MIHDDENTLICPGFHLQLNNPYVPADTTLPVYSLVINIEKSNIYK